VLKLREKRNIPAAARNLRFYTSHLYFGAGTIVLLLRFCTLALGETRAVVPEEWLSSRLFSDSKHSHPTRLFIAIGLINLHVTIDKAFLVW